MGRTVATAAALSLSGTLLGCALPFQGKPAPKNAVSVEQRRALLRRARVWQHTDVARMDMREGPAADLPFKTGATLPCTYVDRKYAGHTPKFACLFGADQVVKVRYGIENGEVYAGVAATRLLWALGFGADHMYPVKIECRGCPARVGGLPSRVSTFEVAAVEKPFPGHDIIASSIGPGWSWADLDVVSEEAGGAPVSQRDALKLLAVLLQHTDNKAEQQRLVCLDHGKSQEALASCAEPFMMVHDLGQTFGTANLLNRASVGSVNLEKWSATPVWKDRAHCVGNLSQSQTGTLTDPIITEEGRKFLAGLLQQLTDRQLHDLFAVARFDRKPEGGGPIDQWVAAFKQKRDDIVSTSCP